MLRLHTIIATVLAASVLAASTGVPMLLHTCLGGAESCVDASCCPSESTTEDDCCGGVDLATVPANAGQDNDACCVETVVVYAVQTSAVASTTLAMPLPAMASTQAVRDREPSPFPRPHDAIRVAEHGSAPPLPPSLHRLGILLL